MPSCALLTSMIQLYWYNRLLSPISVLTCVLSFGLDNLGCLAFVARELNNPITVGLFYFTFLPSSCSISHLSVLIPGSHLTMETSRSVDNDSNAYQDWHDFHYSVPGSWSSVTARTTPNSSADFVTIYSTSSTEAEDADYPTLRERGFTEDDLARVRSHRRSHLSEHGGESREDWLQIEKLISRMFGQERRATSEEDRTKHVGVVWRNLTVQGVGLGASIQPTNGLLLMRLPRLIIRSLAKFKKGTAPVKPPVRTILDDFTVSLFNSNVKYRR